MRVFGGKFSTQLCLALFLSLLCIGMGTSQVLLDDPPELRGIDVDENLGGKINLNLRFLNHNGEEERLKEHFFRKLPVVIILHYSDCEMLCHLVLNAAAQGLRSVSYLGGVDYHVLAVSINPDETSERAKLAYERYIKTTRSGSTADAWTFFTGDSSSISELADSLGFRFYKVEKTGEYAHPAVIFMLTEDGTISRYLYGIDFPERDVRLALLEASEGKIGTTMDKILLYCFHYDPKAGSYVALAVNIMKLGGGVMLALMLFFLGGFWLNERRKSKKSNVS